MFSWKNIALLIEHCINDEVFVQSSE